MTRVLFLLLGLAALGFSCQNRVQDLNFGPGPEDEEEIQLTGGFSQKKSQREHRDVPGWSSGQIQGQTEHTIPS